MGFAAPLAHARPHQSTLAPFGPAAGDIATLWWVMLIGAVAIFIGVMALVLLGLRQGTAPSALGGRVFIIGGGVIFPGVVLTALLIYTVAVGARLTAPAPRDALHIEVTGYMWWWEVRYRGPAERAAVVSANEIRIPVGRPVHLSLKSADVIHSFWVPNLAGKMDMIPGRTNRLVIQADAPGIYRGQCAEFCGTQHGQMALHVVAEEAAVWDDWFGARRRALLGSEAALLTPAQQHGRAVFVAAGCGGCHGIAGVAAPPAGIAPDLTHIGSRPSLGAGLLANTPGNLAAWIADAQQLKPGSKMPPFHALRGDDLTALTAYLGSLQ
ncbi:MAG: cytochrome c oxidase subunit II [Burkholderiaceae bacterium]|nr:cytochrome c oxidase subunit II [Burkholderiaceae bacterium]